MMLDYVNYLLVVPNIGWEGSTNAGHQGQGNRYLADRHITGCMYTNS